MCMDIASNMNSMIQKSLKSMKKNIKIRLNYMLDKVFLLMFGHPNVKKFDKS